MVGRDRGTDIGEGQCQRALQDKSAGSAEAAMKIIWAGISGGGHSKCKGPGVGVSGTSQAGEQRVGAGRSSIPSGLGTTGKFQGEGEWSPERLPSVCLPYAIGAGVFCQGKEGLRGEAGPRWRLQFGGGGVQGEGGASPAPQQDRWGQAFSPASFPGKCDRIHECKTEEAELAAQPSRTAEGMSEHSCPSQVGG